MTPKTFLQVREILDDIPDINCGGCGVSALTMYRWRKANNKRDAGSFVLLYDDSEELFSNEQAIESGDYSDMIVPAHVVLKVGRRYYDSTGTYYSTNGYVTQDGINETILLHLLNDCLDGWNDYFNRDEIKTIEELTGIDLSDVER